MKEIIKKGIMTNTLEKAVCPHCLSKIKSGDVFDILDNIGVVDPHGNITQNGINADDFRCPVCGKKFSICVDLIFLCEVTL